MIYTGKLAAFQEGLSRLSYDETSLVCGNNGCTNHVNQVLVVPGEQIGRPGHLYRVVRCLNCIFWGPYFVYFGDKGQPLRVEFNDGQCQNFLRNIPRDPASVQWITEPPNPDYDGSPTFAGGQPDWVQEEEEAVCPECAAPMEFILQLSSMTMDGWRDDLGNPLGYSRWPQELGYKVYMTIEHYATLFLFVCDRCHITCSITQDT